MKSICYYVSVLIFSIIILSCASSSKDDGSLSLEDLCNKAATEICGEIEGKVKQIAILDVDTEYWSVSDYIVDELAHYFTRRLGNGNVIAHDDFTRSLIMNELEYQQSGMVSDETIQEIGRELGVDAVIIGQLSETSSGWNVFVKATQTESKKILSSWKGRVKKTDTEMKFQIEKSRKSERPKSDASSKNKNSKNNGAKENALGVSISMINASGDEVSVLHPKETIRFRINADKTCYLAIKCIDANKEENWLPIQNNLIRAGESRIFPDIPGAVLKVDEGTFGKESVTVYAATVESDLPNQKKMMGTRGFSLANENAETAEAKVEYRVER